MATETPPGRCATIATETPPMAIETPPMATETPPGQCATLGTETPPMAIETPSMATETPPGRCATMATETPPMATETPPGRCATMATETSPSRGPFIFIVMMSTVPILVTGYVLVSTLLMLRTGDPKCENPRLDWDLWFEAFLLLLLLVGSIGVLFKMQAVQITCIALLILTSILILAIGWGIELGGTFAKDTKRIDDAYRLETYGPLAKKFLLKDRGWNTFRNCLIERKICDKLDKRDFVQGTRLFMRDCLIYGGAVNKTFTKARDLSRPKLKRMHAIHLRKPLFTEAPLKRFFLFMHEIILALSFPIIYHVIIRGVW